MAFSGGMEMEYWTIYWVNTDNNGEEAKIKSDGGRVLPLSQSWSKNHYTRKYVTFQHHVSRSS